MYIVPCISEYAPSIFSSQQQKRKLGKTKIKTHRYWAIPENQWIFRRIAATLEEPVEDVVIFCSIDDKVSTFLLHTVAKSVITAIAGVIQRSTKVAKSIYVIFDLVQKLGSLFKSERGDEVMNMKALMYMHAYIHTYIQTSPDQIEKKTLILKATRSSGIGTQSHYLREREERGKQA